MIQIRQPPQEEEYTIYLTVKKSGYVVLCDWSGSERFSEAYFFYHQTLVSYFFFSHGYQQFFVYLGRT